MSIHSIQNANKNSLIVFTNSIRYPPNPFNTYWAFVTILVFRCLLLIKICIFAVTLTYLLGKCMVYRIHSFIIWLKFDSLRWYSPISQVCGNGCSAKLFFSVINRHFNFTALSTNFTVLLKSNQQCLFIFDRVLRMLEVTSDDH